MTMHQRGWKNQIAISCQEPIFKKRLIELFIEAKKAKDKIIHCWFVCQSQLIYGYLYSKKVIKNVKKRQNTPDLDFFIVCFKDFDDVIGSASVFLLKLVKKQVIWSFFLNFY